MQNTTRFGLGLVGLLVAGTASAAVDAAVTTAIASAQADGSTIGAAVLACIIVIAAFKLMRRAV